MNENFDADRTFAHLNPSQKKAVLATEGRVLILAGAGSGKTSVLAYRIAHLVRHLRVAPESILGLTFTNKAAGEMRERVGRIIDRLEAKKVTLSTFHSFCLKILRKEIHRLGYTANFTLYDEKDIRRLTTQLARHMLEHEGELPSLEQTMGRISFAKSRGMSYAEVVQEKPTWHDTFSSDLFDRLKSCMRAYNAVDFDSLLSLTVELFEKHPDVLRKYQEQYRYIMIDEYQDTNPVQYRLAQLLSERYGNLCVVGDDDQSIYGWRGAEIKNILQFESATVIKLEQNYRSTPTILSAANALIAHNTARHNKQLWSDTTTGEPITLFHAPGELEEAQSVVQRMIRLHKERKIPWGEMAILYRSNILSRAFEMVLMQAVWERDGKWVRGIPYEIFGGTEFLERAEIKDLLAYLRVIANPLDQEALLRIINWPRRGISDQTLDKLTGINREKHIPLWELLQNEEMWKGLVTDKAAHAIRHFVQLLQTAQEKFRTPPFTPNFNWLIETIDYKRAIADDVKSEKMREFKWENVEQCVDVMALYEEQASQEGTAISLADFLATSLLDQEKTPERDRKKRDDRVSLMTFHSAKGLEFTACFLVGLEDHLLPHEKSLMETGLEEERRLFYVALTRARQHLTLSMARQRKKMGKDLTTNPSRFLFELPKEHLKVTSWQTVE